MELNMLTRDVFAETLWFSYARHFSLDTFDGNKRN